MKKMFSWALMVAFLSTMPALTPSQQVDLPEETNLQREYQLVSKVMKILPTHIVILAQRIQKAVE